jgi:endonuclease/exonuclease/phosphatase family metal-dependent hydrolase
MLRVSTVLLFVRRVAGEAGGRSAAGFVCSPGRAVRSIHRLIFALIAIGSVAGGASAQTTVTLSAPGSHINADLTIQGGSSSLVDFSTSAVLASKVSSESYTRRIMLKFDTQNFIPANAVIQSARLHLVLRSAESNEQRPLTAFHVTQSFVTHDTNWLYFRPGQAWITPGGDLGPSFGITNVGSGVGSTYTFDLTSMVQRVVKGEFGSRYTRLALVDTGGRTDGNYREFHSTRAVDATLRPRLVIVYGTAPLTTPVPWPSTTLRVMQWNVHKTKGSDGLCDPDRIANAIVAQQADVVSVNEVNFFSGACAWTFHMGEKLEALVEQKTGLPWYRQDVNVNGGSTGYGNVLLSRYPPVSSSSTLLSYARGVAQMGIVVNGRNVNLFSTHIEYVTPAWRPIQIAEAANWMTSFSEPRILMGDFNTAPGTSDYGIIATLLQDAWVAGQSAGTATAYNGTGATHGSSRFDYVFYSKVAALSLKSVNVPDSRVNGVYPSDHEPVVVVFSVN